MLTDTVARERREHGGVENVGELEDKAKGEIKESGGELTGDKTMEWEGKADKMKGKVEETGRQLDEDAPDKQV
jgi:uncharacterized protein YjbJ (UPF0337 family)